MAVCPSANRIQRTIRNRFFYGFCFGFLFCYCVFEFLREESDIRVSLALLLKVSSGGFSHVEKCEFVFLSQMKLFYGDVYRCWLFQSCLLHSVGLHRTGFKTPQDWLSIQIESHILMSTFLQGGLELR